MGNEKKKGARKKCFLYTRVSTSMQVEGYSLEAQENKLRLYAKLHDLEVVEPVFSDEGKSGKNIQGREQFQAMMDAIKSGASEQGVKYVLTFKLSRFGRDTADVLNAVQTLQDHGVELICTDDAMLLR